MLKRIEVRAWTAKGKSFALQGLVNMMQARRKARAILGYHGPKAVVEVVLNGCVKRVYGSLESRRLFKNYMPSSEVLNAKA